MITEGTLPSPPYCSWAYRGDDISPVQELSHFFGEHKAGGTLGESLAEVLKISHEN